MHVAGGYDSIRADPAEYRGISALAVSILLKVVPAWFKRRNRWRLYEESPIFYIYLTCLWTCGVLEDD